MAMKVLDSCVCQVLMLCWINCGNLFYKFRSINLLTAQPCALNFHFLDNLVWLHSSNVGR